MEKKRGGTMNQKIVKFIKKHPLLFYSAKFAHKILFYKPFLFRLLFNPNTIKNKWYGEIKKTQLNKHRPLFLDRQKEIKDFFNVNNLYLLKYYLKYGYPNTNKFKEHYLQAFENNTAPDKLKKAYDNIPLDYTLRLMLAYERYSMMTDYLDFMIKDSNKNLGDFKVLDYGCGVSDIGLLFASFGAKVTICDLDNSRFDFTISRFKKRGLNPETIRVTNTEVYPKLPVSKFDLIIATELLEHVRDPFKLLNNFTKALNKSGYLFDSMGGKFDRDNRPHHLKEALKIGNSKEYKKYYSKHYIHLSPKKGMDYLFKKRN